MNTSLNCMISLGRILGKQYYPLNRVEISRNALLHNYSYLSSISHKLAIVPVLKSNAYGHGVVKVAKIFDQFNPPFFCVNSYEEALELHRGKIKTPILIMGYCNPQFVLKNSQLSFAVYDKEQLGLFQKYYPSAKLHIFADTGMHREGMQIEDFQEIVILSKKYHMNVEGLMSHFACGDKPNCRITKLQIENFQLIREILNRSGMKPRWFHIAASSAFLRQSGYKDLGNMARVGLALYGFDPGGLQTKLRPILKLTSTLVQIKRIKKCELIGYDGTFRAQRNMTIGILPLGYNDGLDRRLSNKGFVTIDKIPCQIVGRVSMNITIVDISKIKNPFVSQEVIVYSDNPNDLNSIENAAKLCKTIPYDLLVSFSSEISREIV